MCAREQETNSPAVAENHRANLQQLQPYGVASGAAQFRSMQPKSAYSLKQRIRHGRQKETKLIGQKLVATGSIGEEAKLLFLDPVFHVGAANITSVVDHLGLVIEIGDDETGVGP